MTKSKTIFISIVIIALIGSALFFYFLRGDKNIEKDPLKTERSDNDSITHSSPEITPVEMGAKPEKNPKNGSIKIVENFIKSNAKHPDTFEFLEWSEVTAESGYWKVRCKYRGVSSFNAEVTTNAWFFIRNQKVVYAKIISKI